MQMNNPSSNTKSKMITINYSNVFKKYKECTSPRIQEQIRSQNTSVQNQQLPKGQTYLDELSIKRQQIRSQSDYMSLKSSPIVPKLNMEKQKSFAEGKISILVTPRKTLSSARNTVTSAQPKSYILNSERRSEAITNDTNVEKGRASSIISDSFADSPRINKGQIINNCEKKKSNFSPVKQPKVSQEGLLISKIKYLLKKHNKKQGKNEMYKNPFFYYKQRHITEQDQHSKMNSKSIHFQSQGQIVNTDQKQLDIKLSERENNFNQKKSQQKLQRCISIQTDKLLSARNNNANSNHLDLSPIRIQIQSGQETTSLEDKNQKLPQENNGSSQHLIFEDPPEKKPQSLSERRQFSLHSTITNFKNIIQTQRKFTDLIRGKSTDHNSPPRNSQHSQLSIQESNQFKIKLLQNLTKQISIQTDLSKNFQNPLRVSKQEKRISQMIAAKMVPNTISAKDIENIYEYRQQTVQNTPCSLQLFLESQLPYQSILERQKQEKQLEQNLRKSINYIMKKNNSQNQSQSNPPSPSKMGITENTPQSLVNLEEFNAFQLQKKCSLILQVPLSPTKDKRISMDSNLTPFELEQNNKQLKQEDFSNIDERRKQSTNMVQVNKDYAPLRIYKSLSSFSKNGFPAKIQDQQKKDVESPSPKKATLLANYIPSKIEIKQSEINNNINKIQFKSLLSFSEQSNQAIFESERNQKLKKIIDENLKKLSPHKQKSINNQKLFRFDTNNTEPDNNEGNKDDSSSPQQVASKYM